MNKNEETEETEMEAEKDIFIDEKSFQMWEVNFQTQKISMN